MKSWPYALAGLIAAAACLCAPARADRGDRDHRWYRGEIREFHDRDLHAWRGGRWYHGYYGGHTGWWWIVGGVYYWYPQAVYPYPDPYMPPAAGLAPGMSEPAQPVYPPASAAPPVAAGLSAPPPAPPVAQGTPPGPPRLWYYCDSAKSYYPYVPTCPSGWRAVPASPAGTP